MFGRGGGGRGGAGRAPSFAAPGRGPTMGGYNGTGRGSDTSSSNKRQPPGASAAGATAVTDCFFFVTKGCTRGTGCAYRHCEPARVASKVKLVGL